MGSFYYNCAEGTVSARGGTRTHMDKAHKILSFARIPIPPLELEATVGFEPTNRGFADLPLRPLGHVAILITYHTFPIFQPCLKALQFFGH